MANTPGCNNPNVITLPQVEVLHGDGTRTPWTPETASAETPMSDHVAQFWRHLETETVRVLVDLKRTIGHDAPDGPSVYWDGASFSDVVAKALVAENKRLREDAEDAKADARRMHQEKMDYFEANLLLRVTMQEACDLLSERTQGSPARSAGHNARVRLESGLASHAGQSPTKEE